MKLIIADDNKGVRESLKILLADTFDKIVTTADPYIIPAIIDAGNVDAIILDMNFHPEGTLDGEEGISHLCRIKSRDDAPAVIVITAFGDVELAVRAMKLGADDFISKPWDNDDLISKILKAINKNRRERAADKAQAEAQAIIDRQSEYDNMTLERLKDTHIRQVIDRCDGNLSLAAARLGINRQTLYNHLKKTSE